MSRERKISYFTLFIAMSSLGAMVKIPAIVGTIALDSLPALIASVLLGPIAGAIVASLGHFISALLSGLPLGPFHLLIAVEMAILVFLFGLLYKKGKKFISYFLFTIGNAIIAPLPFLFIIHASFYFSILPSLFIGTTLNIILAIVVLPRLQGIRRTKPKEVHIR
ncbi:putative membrane protein [Bacillus pakistanensis]|uniref:Membrane protein n=1 Tax=Rossellomorea pakistanensis TaxID=992288 RepID=A0ABS2N7N7_9BACI|nr:ECF transporter S component [Bacillus pakistanensis]MBM7583843.1 putative membrane protein [Bacillus pakistanensis]